MSRRHRHDCYHDNPAPTEPGGLFDNVRVVNYNAGEFEDDGTTPKFIDAYVMHATDEKNLVLGHWNQGVLTQLNDGNPVPERAVEDYGPEGGGVTWTDLDPSN